MSAFRVGPARTRAGSWWLSCNFVNALPYHPRFQRHGEKRPGLDHEYFTCAAMQAMLANTNATRWKRISAALGLSWRQRVDEGRPIDVPCFDFNAGAAQFAILPAESFVGYQLAAQRLRAESFVMVAGFGDGAPGCIATDQCWRDGYADGYCWVPPMTEQPILEALAEVMGKPTKNR